MANEFYSPLRYPGGKTRLAPFFKSLFYENKIVGCDYFELFAGGAGLALSLLFEEYVSTITINDYDRSIYAFWHSVKHENERFCAAIDSTPISVETWFEQRELQKNKNDINLFDLGFSTFYLNRTNVSGVIKGGLIGGIEQLGKYKMDARYNKYDLIKKIARIGVYKDRIAVENEDAIKFIKKIKSGSFIYLDPPYVDKAKDLYMNYYGEREHRDISETLLNLPSDFYWLLSYDENALIHGLYNDCKKKLRWGVGYGPSKRRVEELLFLSKQLKIDDSKKVILP